MGLAVSTERHGDATVVRLEGEFDLYASAEVRQAADPVLEDGDHLLVDLTGVTFLDSSGLGTLVGLQKRAKLADARMTLCGLSPRLYKIFDVTALRGAFTFVPDLASLEQAGHDPGSEGAPDADA
jgi:anti-sigma B factor antagonist